ncbi:hypothetical protein [Thermomonospora umbrina]|uniref:hypothetical protein n=1 Tax=Thermomonospora umbrina TaxID=111806 RepID=UPI000E248413|nr:hypothetical protein [Thermomonospora umbrina]
MIGSRSGACLHEGLVSVQTFIAAHQVGQTNNATRKTSGLNTARPATKRSYVLRSYITCAQCGRRLGCKDSRGRTYYVCRPTKGYAPEGHPKSI